MQPGMRGESRRRGHTPEPTRRRRTSSSSSITLPSYHTYLNPILQSTIYYIAAAPSLPLILLALPITLLSTVFFLLFRPSISSIRITFRTPNLPILTFLHVSHIIVTLLAIRLIGPVRALLTLGSNPAITRISTRRSTRSITCAALTLLALSLLTFDVSLDAPAAKVRDRMLLTPTGRAVHARIRRFSNRIRLGVRRAAENASEVPLSDSLEQPKPPADPPPPSPLRTSRNVSDGTAARRRLMAIVKGDDPDEQPKPPASEHGNNLQNESVNALGPNEPGPLSNASTVKEGGEQAAAHDSRAIAEGDASHHATSHESVPRFVAAAGVFLGCAASVIGRAATEMRDRVMNDAGDWSAVSVSLFASSSLLFSVMLVATSIAAVVHGEAIFTEFFSNALPRGVVLSLAWLVVPVLMQVHGRGLLQKTRGQRAPKGTGAIPAIALSSSMLDMDSSTPTVLYFYFAVVFTLFIFRAAGVPIAKETVGTLAYVAGVLLLISSKMASASAPQMPRRGMTGSTGDLSAHLTKSLTSRLRSLWLSFRSSVSTSLKGVKDLVVHARSNKASWQVLNFLILQSTMAMVELVYATITNSSGLFSISADNFFCSVALAIGLIAIRISSRKPSPTFSYGYGRIESLCGFANGIILIYVGILVILEAFERSNEDAAIAIGRAFSVCLLGLIGNVLGLYFFPPESRRENHNVQGIYLHIWANTFSFARIAISTGITTVLPEWKSVDMISAAIVGLGMVISAIPLVIRSGRLLLLISLLEKEKSLNTTKSRLEELSGVNEVSALRVWNLTPNCLVASVRLKVSRSYEGSDAEILSCARAVFTMIGIAQSQCTIQITRVENDVTESVVYLHKRTRSSIPDTGINVDMLTASTRSKTDSHKEGAARAVLTL